MPDRLSGLEVFVHAIRLGSLSAAARELKMSAAMAAKHFDALERRLGVSLARRTTRSLTLTETGRRFLSEAERLLAELEQAEADASASGVVVAGKLRVSAPVSFGVRHVAPLLPGFLQSYPNVTVELGLTDRYVNLMEENWDVAVRIARIEDMQVIARKLVASVSMVVCGSPAYLKARGTPTALADLRHHNCLGYTLSPVSGTQVWRFGKSGDIAVPISGLIHSDNGDALLAAATAGEGLVYSPTFIAAAALARGDLVELPLGVDTLDLGGVYAVTHPQRRPSAKSAGWIDYLAASLAGPEF